MSVENAKSKFEIVDTDQKLKAVLPALKQCDILAVDLEADSMYNFREKVCLIQLAVPGLNLVVDPLMLSSLTALEPLLASKTIQKIFHGADYDIRSLYRDFGFEVNNLFDTELACRFLGVHETGLDAVLRERFGIRLDKRFQRKDWSNRPLPHEMIEYAARDVVYLHALAEELQRELKQKGRYNWVVEECTILSKVRPAAVGDEPLFMRFKGAGRLDRRSLAVLEHLLLLRMRIAEKKDRPVFKIMSSKSLLRIAVEKPRSISRLQKMGVFSDRQINMYAEEVLSAVKQGMVLPEKDLPVYPRKRAPRPAPELPDRVKAIKKWRDRIADELRIDPAMLFNKTLMTTIAAKRPQTLKGLGEISGIRNWQRTEFGKGIITILRQQK